MMPTAKLVREARRLVKKWRRVLGIGTDWNIGVRVLEEPEGDGDKNGAQAYITTEPGYFFANMTINAWRIGDSAELEHAVVHELTHVLVEPVRTIARGAMGEALVAVADENIEALCERVARALLRAERG
jgi:hypothetical protein